MLGSLDTLVLLVQQEVLELLVQVGQLGHLAMLGHLETLEKMELVPTLAEQALQTLVMQVLVATTMHMGGMASFRVTTCADGTMATLTTTPLVFNISTTTR
jgi:hypothetical protein